MADTPPIADDGAPTGRPAWSHGDDGGHLPMQPIDYAVDEPADEAPSVSPLRQRGVYLHDGLTFTAIHLLGTNGELWRSTGLVRIRPGETIPNKLLYLRHVDNVLIDGATFGPIGTIDDLTDTGETEDA